MYDPDSSSEPVDPQRRKSFPGETQPPSHLGWAIVVSIFCGIVPGFVAISYATQVAGRHNAGDTYGALQASRSAMDWVVITLILAVPYVAALIFLMNSAIEPPFWPPGLPQVFPRETIAE
jgi:Interferon-induced transmembrane protein